MAKEKRPYMPFYGREFYSDIHVEEMSFAQQGMYLKLCWLAWTEGSIPSDPARVARILRTDESEFIQDHAAILIPRFKDQSDGSMTHRKVETIRDEVERYSESRSKAGKVGADVRWAKQDDGKTDGTGDGKTEAEPLAKVSPPISNLQSPNSYLQTAICEEKTIRASDDAHVGDSDFSLSPPKAKQPDPREEWFDQFWVKYRTWRSDDKKRAHKKFMEFVTNETIFSEVLAGFDEQNAEMLERPKGVRPYAKAWLHGECWKRDGGEVAPTIHTGPPTRQGASIADLMDGVFDKEKKCP